MMVFRMASTSNLELIEAMKISANASLTLSHPSRHLWAGWFVVATLSMFEFLAAQYGEPLILQSSVLLKRWIEALGSVIPMVDSFGRCSDQLGTGSKLMLALDWTFFPIKLGALYLAHPKKLANPEQGWRRIWASVYVFLIALVALVPLLMWAYLQPSASDLGSLNFKKAALCRGGLDAFSVAMVQGGFALAGAYVSLLILIGLLRPQFGLARR